MRLVGKTTEITTARWLFCRRISLHSEHIGRLIRTIFNVIIMFHPLLDLANINDPCRETRVDAETRCRRLTNAAQRNLMRRGGWPG